MNLFKVLVDAPGPNILKDLIWNCDSPKLRILCEIMFETGMDEVELLEERVYQYGSLLKEQDYLDREIFMGMISLLEAVKNQETL